MFAVGGLICGGLAHLIIVKLSVICCCMFMSSVIFDSFLITAKQFDLCVHLYALLLMLV